MLLTSLLPVNFIMPCVMQQKYSSDIFPNTIRTPLDVSKLTIICQFESTVGMGLFTYLHERSIFIITTTGFQKELDMRLGDTIAAIATSTHSGGVGIIRISGPKAHAILAKTLRKLPEKPDPRRLYFGSISSPPHTRSSDSGFGVLMPGPQSFTGEDVAEIQCHGGALNLQRVLTAVLQAGARAAERGEFTRRAFLNNRLDLTQAEAVLDIIEARTAAGLDSAQRHLHGNLGQEVEGLRKRVLRVLAHLEVQIDFVTEDLPTFDAESMLNDMRALKSELDALAHTFEQGKILRQGVSVALAGPPNVGKSSLFNALLKESRSIVTDIPGTTRDYIEEHANLGGVPMVLVDTAGLRHTEDAVESAGVERTHQRIEHADIVLSVHDITLPSSKESHIRDIPDSHRIDILNKTDQTIHPTWEHEFPDAIRVSALTGEGLSKLVDVLKERAGIGGETERHTAIITRARHFDALQRASQALEHAATALESKMPTEIIAGEIQLTLEAVGDIVGVTTSEDVLDQIFGEFCIGK
jgi:tRNA modification GTPase